MSNKSFLLCPLQPQYYASTEALLLAAAPERKECIHAWPQDPSAPDEGEYVRRDYVAVDAEDPQQVIGYGAIWPQGAGRFRMDLIVAQAWRRRGLGTALLEQLLQSLRAQNASIVQARTPDYRSESLAFLARHGFTQTNRMIHLRHNLTQADIRSLPVLSERLAAQGITIVTLAQEQEQNADWFPKVLDLICATMPDRIANPYRIGSETEFCNLKVATLTWESYRPLSGDAFFLAKRGDRYIGMSYLAQGDTARHLLQGDTGVHIDWRRQGVATLLKLHAIAYAQEHGYDSITTSTASPGMLALNERLGFQQEWTEVRLVKLIEE